MLVSFEDLEARYPRPMPSGEKKRAESLLADAEELLIAEFSRADRDLYTEVKALPWVAPTAKRVIREMVSAAMLVGDDVGRRSSSVTAGQVSESYTFADVDSVSWGGIRLTDAQREALGLPTSGLALGDFPPAPHWPERWPQ